MIAILLIGAWLRWSALSPMRDLLSYDEAYNGVDVLSLLHEPRLTPFFPDNFGRESGWMYVLTPSVAIFGAQPFALRVVATMVGVLTIAAMYALSREMLGRRGATWAAAVLAVLYWAVHISTLGLRANLMLLIGPLALAAFARSVRTNQARWWIGCGVALGALAYTYSAARLWLGVQAVALLGLSVFVPRLRRGAIGALAIAAVLSAPLAAYTVLNPDVALNRIADVGLTDISAIWHNTGLWLQAFWVQGDNKPLLNLPGRPIFDPLFGMVFVIGLIALPWLIKRRWQLAWLAALSLAAVAPSILSADAPHFLRASGLIVPISLATGAGVWELERMTARLSWSRLRVWFPASLIVVAALITDNDFHGQWLQQPAVMTDLGRYDQRLVEFIKQATPETTPIYLPFAPYTPLIDPRTQFRIAFLAPRPVSMFDWRECTVLATEPAIYSSASGDSPDFVTSLARIAQVKLLGQILDQGNKTAVFDIYQVTPQMDTASDRTPVVFGRQLKLQVLTPISETARPDEVVSLRLAAQALQPLNRDYSLFIHLYNLSLADIAERLVSQGDSQLCISYPSHLWSTSESIIQDFKLPVPADLPPGTYSVAVGVYDSESLERLPVQPSSTARDSFEVQRIQVKAREP